MRLDELTAAELPGLRVLSPTPDWPEIKALAYDSRRVRAGTLFFCVFGHERDGHDFAAQALAAGAAGLVVERPLELGVPELLVDSTRAAMAPLAARFYREPSSGMRVVGVTGTNGKTTTAHLVRALLEAIGERCGLLGTVESRVGGQRRPASRTTPEAIDLQADLRAMLDGGERSCAMEVSSHALALGRTDCLRFAAAIFTNLTQDHLDFHKTMEDYFQAKRRLFVAPAARAKPGVAVVNLDDPYGRRLAGELEEVVTFAIDTNADYRARELRIELGRTHVQLDTPSGTHSLSLGLPGRFNVANALGALAAVHALGGDLDTLLAALERGVRVPGRLEPVEAGQDFAVFVDYAHTPDSLQNVLRTAQEVSRGRVICVFGAGGDRDRSKRPLMGEIGARLADVLLVTSDNPRSEDPQEILEQIMLGADQVKRPAAAAPLVCELDRRAAIDRAVELAEPGDVLVIAGKGHEQGQEFAAGAKVPFDDVTVAREALGARGFHKAGV
ncbi:MAG TPA: UDP-N-acetylmuramoyl-L-alanyl-D-glutamate--2,6-diaminopimelate ligase, partial [Solirubrobacteraceae bacterium]|nr:UDP-N-acetylmuramoyl-L-alanyl-D-glutamate--2,6-diaminopimelate ligase [Solirubrobacteraceae bacterium]